MAEARTVEELEDKIRRLNDIIARAPDRGVHEALRAERDLWKMKAEGTDLVSMAKRLRNSLDKVGPKGSSKKGEDAFERAVHDYMIDNFSSSAQNYIFGNDFEALIRPMYDGEFPENADSIAEAVVASATAFLQRNASRIVKATDKSGI